MFHDLIYIYILCSPVEFALPIFEFKTILTSMSKAETSDKESFLPPIGWRLRKKQKKTSSKKYFISCNAAICYDC